MEKQIKCPKCGTVQPRHRYCIKCKLDFQAYAAYLRKKREAAQAAAQADQSADQSAPKAGQPAGQPAGQRPAQPQKPSAPPTGGSPLGKEASGIQAKVIVCPKCRMKQPLRPKCAKCGFDIKSYVLQKQQGGTPDINIEKPVAPPSGPPKSEWGESKPLRPDQFGADDNPFDSTSRYWTPPPPTGGEGAAGEASEQEPDPWAPTGEGLRELGKLFSDAWAMYTKRLGTLMGVYISAIALAVMPMVLLIVLGAVGMSISQDLGIFISIAFGMLGALLFIYFGSWGYSAMYFAVTDRSLGFKSAWSYGRTRIWSMLWLLLLLAYIVQGALLLFIVPGILAAIYFSIAKFVMIEEGATGMNALLRSRHYIKGSGWAVFGRLMLIWLLAAAVGAVPFIGPILSLFATPYTMLYMLLIYRDLHASKQGLPGYAPTGGEKAKWLVASTFGFILATALVIAAIVFIANKYGGDYKPLLEMMKQGQLNMQEFEGMAEQRGPGGIVRPHEYDRITGRWSGRDSDGNNYTFEFMEGYYASITSDSLGVNYGAELFVDFDIGQQDGDSVRVPPGASLMDFRIASSVNSAEIGLVAAGVYSLRFGREMTLCTGMPGSGVRPVEYEPSDDVVCFYLSRQAGDVQPSVSLNKDTFQPGEVINVAFTAPPTYKSDAWIGIVPSSVSHGSEAENDSHDLTYQYLSGQTVGILTFHAPSSPGMYDIRMNDTDSNGKEVAYASFTVAGGSYGGAAPSPRVGGSSSRGPAEQGEMAWLYVYSWNYKGEIILNGKSIQVLEGKPNVQYNYNTSADMKRGTNVLDVSYTKVAGQENYSIEITFTDSNTDRKYGPFTISGGEGSKRFTFNYP